MTPKLKSYLLGSGVGAVVTGAVGAFPFAPWQVAVAAGTTIGVASIALIRSMLDKTFLLGEPPATDADDGSGERPVWSPRDMNRLSPHAAWANGNSILPSGDDTQEMPRPRLDDQTHIMRADEVFGRQGRHQAGVRWGTWPSGPRS